MTDQDIEILLVEDNPKDVELTLYALKKHNLANNVVVARDGQEALDYFFAKESKLRVAGKNTYPKLVLLDLKMPLVSGIDVLRRLKSDEATKSIPIVVMTSSNVDKDVEECYRLGVNSYLRKPVDFNQFVEAAKTIGLYWLLMNRTPP
jgi:CheY-like chemotaxis protein